MAHVWNITDGDIYVSKNGDDVAGDGSMSAPYASFNKATTEGTDGDKIVIGTGVWQEERGVSTNSYKFFADGESVIDLLGGFRNRHSDELASFTLKGNSTNFYINSLVETLKFRDCIFDNVYFDSANVTFYMEGCVFFKCFFRQYYTSTMTFYINRCIFAFCSCVNAIGAFDLRNMEFEKLTNSILYKNIHFGGSRQSVDYICMYDCNWATSGANQVSLNSIQEGGYMQNSIGLNPLFNDFNAGDYTLNPNSPCLYSGKNNATIGAFGLGYSFGANSSEFTTEGGATFSQTSSENDIIRTQQSINGITRFLFQLNSGHTSGNIESAWIDLQQIRYLLITRLFANIIYNASGVATSRPDNLESAGEKAVYYDFELKYCNEESEKDTAVWKNVIWNKAVTIDNSGNGNADPSFAANEAQYISARFIKIKLYMTEA